MLFKCCQCMSVGKCINCKCVKAKNFCVKNSLLLANARIKVFLPLTQASVCLFILCCHFWMVCLWISVLLIVLLVPFWMYLLHLCLILTLLMVCHLGFQSIVKFLSPSAICASSTSFTWIFTTVFPLVIMIMMLYWWWWLIILI